jgi:hypothetical protein
MLCIAPGLIGHNGAGNQAAGQPLGRLPQAARKVRRRGNARINMTLLKMLNGLIKPDAGSIAMRGRVGALIARGAGFNPILTGREPKGWPPARRVLRLGEAARRPRQRGKLLGRSCESTEWERTKSTSNRRLARRVQRRREGATQKIYIMAPCLSSRKPIEIFFINTNLKL